MGIEHEIDQGALEPGTGPLGEGEAGTGNLGRTLEIDDVEIFADIPVRLRLETELVGRSPATRRYSNCSIWR